MQIPPSTALLHALSRIGENAAAPPRPAALRGDGAAASTPAVVVPDAARAAAKAAFQALRQPPQMPVNAVMQPQAPAAPPQQPAKQLPRGSFLNVLV